MTDYADSPVVLDSVRPKSIELQRVSQALRDLFVQRLDSLERSRDLYNRIEKVRFDNSTSVLYYWIVFFFPPIGFNVSIDRHRLIVGVHKVSIYWPRNNLKNVHHPNSPLTRWPTSKSFLRRRPSSVIRNSSVICSRI